MDAVTHSSGAALDKDGEAKVVSALARGIGIVQCFSPMRQELSARELMELTGLPKPTLFRLLETLCDLGLLRYSERVSRYVAGGGLLNAAAAALARMTVRQLARPLMEDLANHICGQVQLMMGFRARLNYVELVQGVGSKVFRPEIGMQVSMSRTASGRAYLCTAPAAEREAYLAELGSRDAARKDWLIERLEDAQRDLAAHGFCRGHGDLHREAEVIAVPMSARKDDEAWIFSATVPVFSPQSKQLVEDVGPRLITLVRSVEAGLGHNG
jgi:DNA-binding IclR family transcriptional regulator